MPCYDDRDNVRTEYVEDAHNSRHAARLCALFTVLEKAGKLIPMLDKCDWKEAGVTQASTEAWWKEHKKIDVQRREMERQARIKEAAKNRAMQKLTAEELQLLGINQRRK